MFSLLTFPLRDQFPTPYIFDDRCDAKDAADQITQKLGIMLGL
jgi:hypothetical protein